MIVAKILTVEVLGICMVLVSTLESAVVAPPWADPGQNPCATEPGGWQLLYWPPDQKCYRIFQKGYPCPDSMELTPSAERGAECRCPPGTAQSPRDAACHQLYARGPCAETEYFAPVSDTVLGVPSKQRWGVCLEAEQCSHVGHVFWPRDRKCYQAFSRGPCPDGQLIAAATSNQLGECQCERSPRMSRYFWDAAGTCHEHYTPGPCQEHGTLFLPGGKCGCHTGLQQYYPETGMCYQLGTVGPCPPGHQFVISTAHASNNSSLGQPTYAKCRCKEGHVRWTEDGICYRPYTRGPCQPGYMYSANNTQESNTTVGCVEVPCPPGRLYFPGGKGCHRVGTQGPCPPGQVVLFQESVKTSVEGISYRGMCGCPSNNYDPESFYPSFRATNTKTADSARCPAQGRNAAAADNRPEMAPEQELCRKRGTILWQEDLSCIQLYTQGPCGEGEWVVPDRGKGHRKGRGWKMGKCECRPGFTATTAEDGKTVCQPPAVYLASFLNRHQSFSEPVFSTELTIIEEK